MWIQQSDINFRSDINFKYLS